MIDGRIDELVRRLTEARRAVALTGAGVSTESGIPDFRSSGGLWQGVDPMQVASIRGFLQDPKGFYRFWMDKFARLVTAQPNVTHHLLAGLERGGHLLSVVTQNIDGLHRKAGSERVHEVHGTFQRARCLQCATSYPLAEVFDRARRWEVPRCDVCGGLLKPDVVLFGEMLPPAFREGEGDVAQADVLVVLGSSLEVYPVADLVPQAKRAGARIVLVNRQPGPYDAIADLVIHGELGPVMEEVRSRLAAA
ncbi:MAG: NAD-dependent protein deacylase [Myxococcota bacterium]